MPLAAKVAQLPLKSDRKNRIARVSAKRPKKEETVVEEGVEPEEVESAEAKPARGDGGGTYLSMYFRDMAVLDVLRPEEEFTSAREIEALEIMLWETVLSHAPVIGRVLTAIATVPDYAMTAEIKALAKFAESKDVKSFARASAKAARKLRSTDVDHLFIDAALGAIDRMSLGIGVRGDDVGSLGKARQVDEWLRRVQGANRATMDARNDFVKANLRLVVSIARRFNHGRMALADLIQEGNLGLLKAVEPLRLSPRLPVLDLRVVVDPPCDQPRARRQGARGPASSAHDRRAAPPDQSAPSAHG